MRGVHLLDRLYRSACHIRATSDPRWVTPLRGERHPARYRDVMAQHASTVTLTAVLRQTESGAAAFLGLGSDGNRYWVKAQNNPQGSRSLVPERIVTNIGRVIGAPVRPIALVEIPPALDHAYAPGYRLRPGLAHGSLDVGQCKVVDDWAGISGRDGNRTRVAYLSALWDLCLGNDPQWLAEFAADAAVWSYDHGFWFAGEVDWNIESMRRVAVTPWVAPSIEMASCEALNRAAAAVESLTLHELTRIALDVPRGWGASAEELSSVAGILFERARGVADRLRETAEQNRFP